MLNRHVHAKLQKGVTMIDYALVVALSKLLSINSIKSQKGVTLIEYALIAALVAVVAIIGLTFLGVNVNLAFHNIGLKLTAP